jgi:hypothetical protein
LNSSKFTRCAFTPYHSGIIGWEISEYLEWVTDRTHCGWAKWVLTEMRRTGKLGQGNPTGKLGNHLAFWKLVHFQPLHSTFEVCIDYVQQRGGYWWKLRKNISH